MSKLMFLILVFAFSKAGLAENYSPLQDSADAPASLRGWSSLVNNVGYEEKDKCDSESVDFYNTPGTSTPWFFIIICKDFQVHEPYPHFAFISDDSESVIDINLNQKRFWPLWNKTVAPRLLSVTDTDGDRNIEFYFKTDPYEDDETDYHLLEWRNGDLVLVYVAGMVPPNKSLKPTNPAQGDR